MGVLQLYPFPSLFSHLQRKKIQTWKLLHFTTIVWPDLHFRHLITPYLVRALLIIVIKQKESPPGRVHKHKMKHHEHHWIQKFNVLQKFATECEMDPFRRRSMNSLQEKINSIQSLDLLIAVKCKANFGTIELKTKNHSSLIGS